MAESVLTFLAQLRPADLNAASLFSPESSRDGKDGQQVVLRKLYVANTSNANVKYTLFFDNESATYDESTAICWEVQLSSGEAEVFILDVAMRNSDGNFAVRTDKADAITFTLFGET